MRVASYELEGELGRGGAGSVFRARGPDGTRVAVKVLHRLDADSRARFARERRLLESLGGEGFVPILDAGDSPQGPWLAFPLLEGGSLRARLARGPLDVDDAVELVRGLARTLGGAHARGIVHRDLKPENVLFDDEGRAFVADLGLAKHFDPGATGAGASVALSKSLELRGTAGYMAPEQMHDAKSVGPSADVFALGSILFECLAGKPAFTGDTLVEVVTRVESGPVPSIRRVRPEVPAAIDALVKRALARDPGKRFPDGSALADALEGRAGAPRRGPLVPALVLVLLVAGGIGGRFALQARARAAREVAGRELDARVDGLLARAEVERALAEATRALEAEPDFALAWALRARAHTAGKHIELARADAERALALAPDDPLVLSWHAFALELRDPRRALAEHDRAVALAPANAIVRTNRGCAHDRLGELDRALADLGRAIELDPGSPRAWGKRAAVHVARGEFREAIADASRAIELEPLTAIAWINRGAAHLNLRELDLARRDLDRAIEIAPRFAIAWLDRAHVRAKTRDLEGALADAARALELDPSLLAARELRVQALCEASRLDEALADVTEALRLAPDDGYFLGLRGQILFRKGDEDAGIADLERAIVLAPNDYRAHSTLGAAYGKRRELAKALAVLTRAIELAPGQADAYLNRGLVYTELDEREAAAADFEQYLTRTPPDDPEVAKIRDVIAKLRAPR